MKVTPIIYEKIRAKHPELRLPMWPRLWPEDKKRAKRLTVDKLIVFRHMKLLSRDPAITDRTVWLTNNQHDRWSRYVQSLKTDEAIF